MKSFQSEYPSDWASDLFRRVDDLLAGKTSYSEFVENFYDYYIEDVPENALSDEEEDFFGQVHERLDWTARNPDAQSRKDGWSDQDEYITWLRGLRKKFAQT